MLQRWLATLLAGIVGLVCWTAAATPAHAQAKTSPKRQYGVTTVLGRISPDNAVWVKNSLRRTTRPSGSTIADGPEVEARTR